MLMLQTYFFTLLVPLLWVGIFLFKNEINEKTFFNKDYTTVLKGLACLIVIYVHVHSGYENPLQDAIGSLAYVCVTLFFMVSAYGMMLSVERNEDYLKDFWRNRLVALLVPCVLVNLVSFGWGIAESGGCSLTRLYRINSYVLVLLQWCVWFYIVEICKKKWFADKTAWADGLLIAGVVLSSLIMYFIVDGENSAEVGWPFERMGLVWGVLLYRYYDKCVAWMSRNRWVKVAVLILLGGIFGVAYLKYKMIYFWGAYLLKVVLGVMLLALAFTAISNRQCKNPILLWLGNVSYEVYLSHGLVMGALAFWLPEGTDSGSFILLTVVVTLALSGILHHIGQPFVKLLRK